MDYLKAFRIKTFQIQEPWFSAMARGDKLYEARSSKSRLVQTTSVGEILWIHPAEWWWRGFLAQRGLGYEYHDLDQMLDNYLALGCPLLPGIKLRRSEKYIYSGFGITDESAARDGVTCVRIYPLTPVFPLAPVAAIVLGATGMWLTRKMRKSHK